MASISGAHGRWIVQFRPAGGKGRRTLRVEDLGPRETRDSLRLKLAHLEAAAREGAQPAGDVLAWLDRLDAATRTRFAGAGLLTGPAAAAVPDAAAPHSGKRSGPITLAGFLEQYIAERSGVKPLTRRHFDDVRKRLVEYFGPKKLLRDVTPRDADAWRDWLRPKKGKARRLADNTVRRWCGRAKQFFRAAIRGRLIAENPFADHKTAVQSNKARFFFVTREVTEKVLASCNALPSGRPRRDAVQWRLVFALCRFAGVRCPSELLPLTWGDVHWESGRIRVRSPKTEHHQGHAERWVPLFPELRPFLTEAFAESAALQTDADSKPVVTICRGAGANLRTHLCRIIGDAGLTPWPKLFQNLRSTRETELAEEFPLHVVTAWLGNSQPVAIKHYLQVTDEHFARAIGEQRAANALQTGTFGASPCERRPANERRTPSFSRENERVRLDATPCEIRTGAGMPPPGLEPGT